MLSVSQPTTVGVTTPRSACYKVLHHTEVHFRSYSSANSHGTIFTRAYSRAGLYVGAISAHGNVHMRVFHIYNVSPGNFSL